MEEQKTLKRTLEMMVLLSQAGGRSIEDLADHFGVHIRTIQRTINTIRDSGYIITSSAGKYKIDRVATKKDNHFDIGNLIHFSREEAWMLSNAIENIDGKNTIKENLLRKLYSVFDSDSIVKKIIEKENSLAISIIYKAIQSKHQIKVKEYTWSTQNNGIREFVAEPVAFAHDLTRVWAYLPGKGRNMLMRISGFAGISSTYIPFKHEKHHKIGIVDIFRSYGFETTPIKLLLNYRAYGYLCDEFPLAKQYLNKTGMRSYELCAEVCNYSQVTRFCLGLPNDVEVISPDDLKEHIINVRDNKSNSHIRDNIVEYVFKDRVMTTVLILFYTFSVFLF